MGSIDSILADVCTAATNSRNNPLIFAKLISAGLEEGTLDEGLALWQAAENSYQSYIQAEDSYDHASQSFQMLLKEMRSFFATDVRVARAVITRKQAAYQQLHLNEAREKAYDSWRRQAKDFFLRLSQSSELLALVSRWGITAERVQQALRLLDKLEELRIQMQDQKSRSSLLHRQHNANVGAAKKWHGNFRSFVLRALADEPELMSSVGVDPLKYGNRAKKSEKPAPTQPIDGRTAAEGVNATAAA